MYNGEDIKRQREAIANNIVKGFSNSDDLLEKAHNHGDVHPNGKWYWESSANGGKGDWRTIKGAGKATANSQSKVEKKEDSGTSASSEGNGKSSPIGYKGPGIAKKSSAYSAKPKNDISTIKINLSEKDFNKIEAPIDPDDKYLKNAPLKLHDYVGKQRVAYYDGYGNLKTALPYINEFYASPKQDKVGGYEIRFHSSVALGKYKTLNEAIDALNLWINKKRIHPDDYAQSAKRRL